LYNPEDTQFQIALDLFSLFVLTFSRPICINVSHTITYIDYCN